MPAIPRFFNIFVKCLAVTIDRNDKMAAATQHNSCAYQPTESVVRRDMSGHIFIPHLAKNHTRIPPLLSIPADKLDIGVGQVALGAAPFCMVTQNHVHDRLSPHIR